jgi:putative flippase GtrA
MADLIAFVLVGILGAISTFGMIKLFEYLDNRNK